MRPFGSRFDVLTRLRSSWSLRRKSIVAAWLIVGSAAALALHPLSRGTAKAPPPSTINHIHLMRSMIAHARLSREPEPISMISGLARKLRAGSLAPAFILPTIAGHGEVSLSSLRGKPVILVFGSLSCDSFCDQLGGIEQMYQAYKDRAAFLFVSVTEAGHRIQGLEFVIDPAGLGTLEERRERVGQGLRRIGMTLPGALDVAESAETAYDAYPNRLVVVDPGGLIALDAGRALFRDRWDLGKVEAWLKAQVGQAGG